MAGLYSNYASASPADIQRKREIAQRLLMNAQQTQPQTIGEGLGAVGDYIYAGRVGRAAEAGDSDIRKQVADMIGGWGGSKAPATPPQQGMPSASVEPVQITNIPPPGYGDSVTVGGDGMGDIAPPAQMPQQQMAQAQMQPGADGRMDFRDVETDDLRSRYEEVIGNPRMVQNFEYAAPGYLQRVNDELERRYKYDLEIGKELRGYEQQFKLEDYKEGQPSTRAQTRLRGIEGDIKQREFNDPGGIKFDEQVATKIAENVPKYISVGENARSMNADLEVMRDIMTSIETGGLKGKALTMFPSLDEASQFIDARVNYWAPRMRVEGSGSTSDLEVGMMVNSWPSLKNSQEANKLVIQMMMRKNAIDAERGKIATMMAANQMDRREGMMRLMQLDQQSVMTPELDKMIRGVIDNSGMKQQPQQQNPQLEDALRKYGNGGTY